MVGYCIIKIDFYLPLSGNLLNTVSDSASSTVVQRLQQVSDNSSLAVPRVQMKPVEIYLYNVVFWYILQSSLRIHISAQNL